jgi:hypothetical protein
MADERVRRVSSPRLLIAVVAAVLMAGAIWLAMRDPAGDAGTTVAAPVVSPLDEYLTFADGLGATGVSVDDLVVDGMRKLAGALGTAGIGGALIPVDLRVAAEHVVIGPDAADTTASVRASLVAAAVALDAEVSKTPSLRGAAEAIDVRQPIAQQREALVTFFMLAAERLRGQ